MKRVAVIGSNGLLSDEICSFCRTNNYPVTVYGVKAPVNAACDRFIRIDLLDQRIDAVDLARHDVVFYAAGAGIQSNLKEDWPVVYALNTMVPVSIAKQLQEAGFGGAFITFGSCFEIGANSLEHRFTERELASSDRAVPSEYCISKRLLTRFVCSNAPSFAHLHLILPTIYGPTEAPHRLIPYTLSKIARGETPQFTSGAQVRQYLYIGDAVGVAFGLIEKGKRGVFNVAGKQRFTVRELVEALYRIKGVALPAGVFGTAQRSDVSMENLQLDDTRLTAELPDFRYLPFEDVVKMYAL